MSPNNRGLPGGTENARPENTARSKLQDWKTQDWKTRHQNAGLENAEPENARTDVQDWKTREKACMESQTAYSTCNLSSHFSVVLISVYSYQITLMLY